MQIVGQKVRKQGGALVCGPEKFNPESYSEEVTSQKVRQPRESHRSVKKIGFASFLPGFTRRDVHTLDSPEGGHYKANQPVG